MKKITKLKLNHLAKVELDKREMNSIAGGAKCCICACAYSGNNGPGSAENAAANLNGGYYSPQGGTGYGSCA